MIAHVAAFIIGAIVAILWTRLVLAVAAKQAMHAALLDVVLMLVGASAYQLWIMQDAAFSIFVAEALGSAGATWWTVRRST